MLLDSAIVLRLLQVLLHPLLTAGLQAAAAPAPWPAGWQYPPLPYAPLSLQPVFVPPSVVQALGSPGTASAPDGVLMSLQHAMSSPSSLMGGAEETATAMPMTTLITVLSSLASGIRVMVSNFLASFAVMGIAQLVRIAFQNFPIILQVLGLSKASMARVIAEGLTRAQCLERAACVLGKHAQTYQNMPSILRWLRSPDGSAREHPVWWAFRTAAEGHEVQCDAFTC